MKKTFGIVALTLLATGCSDPKPSQSGSVDSHGYCTQSFVDDFHSIQLDEVRLEQLSRNAQIGELERVRSACTRFRMKHGGISCRASTVYGDDVEQMSYADKQAACEYAEVQLVNLRTGRDPQDDDVIPSQPRPPREPREPREPGRPGQSRSFSRIRASDLRLTVIDSELFTKAVSLGGKLIFADGLAINRSSRRSETAFWQVHCDIRTLESARLWTRKAQNELALSAYNIEHETARVGRGRMRYLLIEIEDDLSISCYKDGDEAMTLGEVRNAISAVVDIRLVR